MSMDERRGEAYDFSNTRALVVGLAREGTALTRFLAEHGAAVTVTDAKPLEALADSVDALADLPVTYALGGHPFALLEKADLIFVSPGVPLDIPLLVEARRRGLPLSSETRLFSRLCPARIVGVTGSSGKTTTTALLGKMLDAAGWRTWVGGNIGHPLISQLDRMRPNDIVVMELSSFQLDLFAPWPAMRAGAELAKREGVLFDPSGWSPSVAAVLNVTPNHLDRHPSMEAYIAAKQQILEHQRPGDVAVLNLDDPVTRGMGARARDKGQRVLWFSLEQEVTEGVFVRGGESVLRLGQRDEVLYRTGDLNLLGRHNQANALAACSLAAAVHLVSERGMGGADIPIEVLRRTATSFRGVEHRLELVRERNHVRWYNDSIATSPERTIAALQSFDAPVVLLGGGRDKHLPWGEMADLTWRKVRHLILFGEAADLIEAAMRNAQPAAHDSPYPTHIHHAGTLPKAVKLAAELAQPGDVVLLSPGGTSFDAYRDFVARGEHFKELVRGLE
jgi:UDP-N-acetylmuramoylalanine--D-glutamate ligase